jgi:hypothetical protein
VAERVELVLEGFNNKYVDDRRMGRKHLVVVTRDQCTYTMQRVNKLWWECWKRQNADSALLENRIIVEGDTADAFEGKKAENHQDNIMCGFEPMPVIPQRLEHMPIRLSVARVCEVSFAFALGYPF